MFLIIVCISIGLTIKLMKISNDKIANNLFSNSLNYSNDLDFLDIINFNLSAPDNLIKMVFEKNKEKPVVINATVLYKVPLIHEMDAVFFIDAPRCLRLLRAMKRDKRSAKEILQRFSSQKNIFAKYKISNADTCRVWNISFPWILEYKIRRILKLWIRKKHYGLSPL